MRIRGWGRDVRFGVKERRRPRTACLDVAVIASVMIVRRKEARRIYCNPWDQNE